MLPVVTGDIKLPSLGETPEAEQRLEEVVGDDDALQLEWLPVLHQPFWDEGFFVLGENLPTYLVGR